MEKRLVMDQLSKLVILNTKNGKPYTHPIYVMIDFQCQVWTLLKDIDKDKLFNYISSPDCFWNADKKKKFKKVFTQVVIWKLKFETLAIKMKWLVLIIRDTNKKIKKLIDI